MAGAYQEIPIGRDYAFTTNVAARLSALGVNLVNAAFWFVAKQHPELDTDAQAVLSLSSGENAITCNTSTNVVTIAIASADTENLTSYNLLFWEITTLTSSNKYYTLDRGRMAIVQPVRLTVP